MDARAYRNTRDSFRRACEPPEEGRHRSCGDIRSGGARWIRSVYEYDLLALDYRALRQRAFYRLIGLTDLGRHEQEDLAVLERILSRARLD